MLTKKVFLVREGHYNRQTGEITPDGIEDARRARDELVAKELGKVVVLTARAARAVRMAQIIGDRFDCEPLLSNNVGRYGNYPDQLKSLDDMLETELAEHDLDPQEPGSLVVVTYGQLPAAAQQELWTPGSNLNAIAPYGSVIEYELGTWVTPSQF